MTAVIDRQPPRGLLRLLLDAPLVLYRLHLGWLLGRRFLMLEHRGRKTGKRRRTVLEVIGRDRERDSWFVASGWGETAAWLRNVEADPKVRISVGLRGGAALAARLPRSRAAEVFLAYARRHPRAFRAIGRVLAGGALEATPADCERVAATMPVLELRLAPGDEDGGLSRASAPPRAR